MAEYNFSRLGNSGKRAIIMAPDDPGNLTNQLMTALPGVNCKIFCSGDALKIVTDRDLSEPDELNTLNSTIAAMQAAG